MYVLMFFSSCAMLITRVTSLDVLQPKETPEIIEISSGEERLALKLHDRRDADDRLNIQ